ncbi:MAG: hypothetical protein WB774_24305 [Xanthobacteraceae bacterium]
MKQPPRLQCQIKQNKQNGRDRGDCAMGHRPCRARDQRLCDGQHRRQAEAEQDIIEECAARERLEAKLQA